MTGLEGWGLHCMRTPCCLPAFSRCHPPGIPPRLSPRLSTCCSWQQRYRWRLGLDRSWSRGRRRLCHSLDNHHAWVNAVCLVPGAGVASGGSEGAVNVW